MNHTHKLVIIGPSHHNTYSMIRCFGESGIKPDVILYGMQDSYILLSVFINESHVASDAVEALQQLQEHYPKASVIACGDDVASQMDLHYDVLHNRYQFFNCGSEGKLTNFMDKALQTDMASTMGFLVPVSVEGTPSEVIRKELPYPCIIKPLESIHGGKNIQICRNEAETTDALTNFAPERKVMVQQFVEKDYEVVIVGLSYNAEIYIPAYIHKHRDTKGGTTYSTVKPIDELPSRIVTSCKQLVQKMAYQGLFGIELIRKNDDYYFIEINLRNDATMYAVAVAGCNLPLIYWKLVNCMEVSDTLFGKICQINSMVEFNDFIHVLKRNVSLNTWLKQHKEAECKYCYCKVDMRVYKKQRKDFVKFIIKLIKNHLH